MPKSEGAIMSFPEMLIVAVIFLCAVIAWNVLIRGSVRNRG
jgi:hypothetical protein